MLPDSRSNVVNVDYAVTFHKSLFGNKCEVNVLASLADGVVRASLSMFQALSTVPTIQISRDDLFMFAEGVRLLLKSAKLIDSLDADAEAHRLLCEKCGANMIVVRAKGKSARYTLSIGNYFQEGNLENFRFDEFDRAIQALDKCADAVSAKVREKSVLK